uniref:SJCHGC04727 protein n=1 Tax=Schistosoma japonicum TaxID=6182 RepID=Q5DFI4_SCHJA|nr:SJCHGC04727 protein [Schistosoma japonicum]
MKWFNFCCGILLIYFYIPGRFSSANLTCYECEIVDRERKMTLWPCDESNGPWQKLDGCKACIKIEEVQRIDFRKPRWGQQYHEIKTVSRLCLRKYEPSFTDTCYQTYGSSSTQKRCYCATDYCNFNSKAFSVSFKVLFSICSFSLFILYA